MHQTGIGTGVAVPCGHGLPITDDKSALALLKELQVRPVFVGLQAEGRDWLKRLKPATVARFDYVCADARTFTDASGKQMRLWIKEEVDIPDPQAFMDQLVKTIEGILDREPIDFYANPTYLPEALARNYDRLWTPARLRRVVDALARNGVALEINDRLRLPKPALIKMAREAGVKFTFGGNNSGPPLGRLEYCLKMVEECALTPEDLWVPRLDGQKPIQVRKPAAGARGASNEPEWRVGLAQARITPEHPVVMSGYAGRTKPFAKVTADLYVKAMVLQDREGQRAVVVTSDLLGFPAAVAEPICERIQKKTGLQRACILLNSSHTHAGPRLALKVPPEDPSGAGEALRTTEYTRWLQDQVVATVERAALDLKPARLSWGGGVVHFVMNRREFTPRGVILGVNARGLADRSVPVLRIDDADGKLRAVLFGAAVHGTTLGGDNYELCGDYAGFAQAYVAQMHPQVQPMFMLGCAGDANPYPRGTMEMTRQHGRTLGQEVCRVLDSKLRPVAGPLRIAFDQVDLPLQAGLSRDELNRLAADKRSARNWAAKQLLALLDKSQKLPTHYACPVSVWQFGQDLTLVGLPGEVVVDYVPRLEKVLGPNQLWIAAYCNDVFGYLPSARVLAEGGYETRGLYSGSVGFFDPRCEEVLVEKVRQLAMKAGRKLPG
jgi:hypothetical protein